MIRSVKVWAGVVGVLACAGTIGAFSLLGPFPAWQTAVYDGLELDYNKPGDIGGPMRVNEGYRWNIPVITYAFDQSFVNYFGFDGIQAVNEAIAVFNNLPPMDRIETDGFSFFINGEIVPTLTTVRNGLAAEIGALDVKSTTMHMLIEQLGLAEPERYAWALGARDQVDVIQGPPNPDRTNYLVFNLNFDPITLRPTNLVNDILYGYVVNEFDADPIPDYAEAVETIDPLADFPFTTVAGGRSILTEIVNIPVVNQFGEVTQGAFGGRLYTGLTHDDVGGLRWLYHRNNFAVENLESNVFFGTPLTGGGSPWTPFFGTTNFGTNILVNTNLLVSQGLRGGINKLRFQRVNFDSLLGRFLTPITNRYMDRFITNGQVTVQPVQRVITRPDIVFTAERLGLLRNFFPVLLARSGLTNWVNNDAINGLDFEVDGGPGVIQGPVSIRFSDQLPFVFTSTVDFFGNIVPGSSTNQVRSVIWGSFDEVTVEPIIYPQYGSITLQQLRQFAVGGGN